MDVLQAIRLLKNGDMGGLEILIACYQAKAVRTAYLVTHDELMAKPDGFYAKLYGMQAQKLEILESDFSETRTD